MWYRRDIKTYFSSHSLLRLLTLCFFFLPLHGYPSSRRRIFWEISIGANAGFPTISSFLHQTVNGVPVLIARKMVLVGLVVRGIKWFTVLWVTYSANRCQLMVAIQSMATDQAQNRACGSGSLWAWLSGRCRRGQSIQNWTGSWHLKTWMGYYANRFHNNWPSSPSKYLSSTSVISCRYGNKTGIHRNVLKTQI